MVMFDTNWVIDGMDMDLITRRQGKVMEMCYAIYSTQASPQLQQRYYHEFDSPDYCFAPSYVEATHQPPANTYTTFIRIQMPQSLNQLSSTLYHRRQYQSTSTQSMSILRYRITRDEASTLVTWNKPSDALGGLYLLQTTPHQLGNFLGKCYHSRCSCVCNQLPALD